MHAVRKFIYTEDIHINIITYYYVWMCGCVDVTEREYYRTYAARFLTIGHLEDFLFEFGDFLSISLFLSRRLSHSRGLGFVLAFKLTS
jgi:hypothetical protein